MKMNGGKQTMTSTYLNEYFGISENYRQILRKERYQLITDDLLQFIIVGLY